MGVVGRLPVYVKGKVWGFTAVIIKLDRLLRNAGIDDFEKSDFYIQFSKTDPNTGVEEFFMSDSPVEGLHNLAYDIAIFPEGDWRLYVVPRDPYRVYYLACWLLLFGVIIAVVFGVYTTRIIKYANELKIVNQRLKDEYAKTQGGIGKAS